MFHIDFILIDCPFTCIFNKSIYTIACNCSTCNVDSFSCTLTDTRTSAPVAESKELVLHVRCPDMRPILRMSLSVLYKQRESFILNVAVVDEVLMACLNLVRRFPTRNTRVACHCITVAGNKIICSNIIKHGIGIPIASPLRLITMIIRRLMS